MGSCTSTVPNRIARISATNGQPELYNNGIWSPICGHWFWDNQKGANLFCQELIGKLSTGIITSARNTLPLASNGFNVGRCNENDESILACTGSKSPNHDCATGKKAGIIISCT